MSRIVKLPREDQGTSPTEAELVRRFVAGEHEAFRPLVGPHLAALRALAWRSVGDVHSADDIVQEALIRAARHLATFRGDSSVRTWLFRIVVRLAAEPGRRPKRPSVPLEADIPDVLGADPAAGALGRELRDRLAEAMERLPARQRTALHLRAAEGLDYGRIGHVLECSAGAARMLVLEARRRVIERLGGYLDP